MMAEAGQFFKGIGLPSLLSVKWQIFNDHFAQKVGFLVQRT
jgi:hypothetical protein